MATHNNLIQSGSLVQLSQASHDAAKALQQLRDSVREMREAQKQYFELMARAKKSKHPDDFTNARSVLAKSKALEKQVDTMIIY